MTIKELAEFTGKTDRTVKNWVNKAGKTNGNIQEKISHALNTKETANYSIDEVELILQSSSMSKDAVSILMQNARQAQQIAEVPTQNVEAVNYEAIGKMIAVAVSSAMVPVVKQFTESLKELKGEVKTKPLELPAPSKTDRATFNQIIKGHARITRQPTGSIYGKVYAEIYYRLRIDLQKRASNKKCSKVDILEQEGLLPQAIAIAREVLV